MARGINKVILLGNCGRDPDMRYLTDGKPVASLSIATTSFGGKNANGESQEKTQWHRVSFFGRLAEVVGQYVRKGSQIYIEGSLNYGQYEKDGITRYTTDIVANEMQIVGSRGDASNGSDYSAPPAPREPKNDAPPSVDPSIDDDIPF